MEIYYATGQFFMFEFSLYLGKLCGAQKVNSIEVDHISFPKVLDLIHASE